MSAAVSGGDSGQGTSATGQDIPDDPDALVEDIARTRAELGDTVEALVAKVDVKAQAKQRAAEVSSQAKAKLQTVKQDLAGRASQLAGKAGQARQAAAANSKTMLGAGASRGRTAVGAGTAAWEKAPAPVQRGAQQVARAVGRYRVPVAAAAGVVLVAAVGWLAIRQRRR